MAHKHEYAWSRGCGADVCEDWDCRDHQGLKLCYCGWSLSGNDGYDELIEMGEVIDPEDYWSVKLDY